MSESVNSVSNSEANREETGKYQSILIFGPPGSGKGTIGKFLSMAGNMFHLSSGDIFRGLSPDSEGGKLFNQYASQGLLVPDDVTIKIWEHFVAGLIVAKKYFPEQQYLLLDGIPRTVVQAEILDNHVDVKQIIVMDMHDEEGLIERLRGRAAVEGRLDDMDVDVLKTRFDVYRNETAKVLEYYPQEKISHFNAEQKPLEILRDILVKLTTLFVEVPAAKQPALPQS